MPWIFKFVGVNVMQGMRTTGYRDQGNTDLILISPIEVTRRKLNNEALSSFDSGRIGEHTRIAGPCKFKAELRFLRQPSRFVVAA